MKFSTALAVPALLTVLGLAACDNPNKQQANQPSDTGQQTGAVPSTKSTGTTGSTTGGSSGTAPSSTTTGNSPSSSSTPPSPPSSGTPPGGQNR